MWILYTHLAFSLICFITCLASKMFVSPEKKEYNKLANKNKIPFILAALKIFMTCLIPVVNVISAAVVFYMAICPLEDYIKMSEKSKTSQNKDKEILEQYKKENVA